VTKGLLLYKGEQKRGQGKNDRDLGGNTLIGNNIRSQVLSFVRSHNRWVNHPGTSLTSSPCCAKFKEEDGISLLQQLGVLSL